MLCAGSRLRPQVTAEGQRPSREQGGSGARGPGACGAGRAGARRPDLGVTGGVSPPCLLQNMSTRRGAVSATPRPRARPRYPRRGLVTGAAGLALSGLCPASTARVLVAGEVRGVKMSKQTARGGAGETSGRANPGRWREEAGTPPPRRQVENLVNLC